MMMQSRDQFGRHATNSRSARCVFAGQVGLNAVLLLAGLWLIGAGNPRARFLLALVPLVFVPFSYARLRLHRFLELHLAAVAWPLAALGLGFDATMVAQLLGARSTPEASLLQAPGVIWIGACWFSAHALLLLGY